MSNTGVSVTINGADGSRRIFYYPQGVKVREEPGQDKLARLEISGLSSTPLFPDPVECSEVTHGYTSGYSEGSTLNLKKKLSECFAEEPSGCPPYYLMPNGVQVADVAEHLTGNGAQAVQYLARSTRLDGQNKGDVIADLEKARDFITREINRVS